ncbi:MAG: hypothetical protein Q9227_000033 [Pyrenula ochraceoflavens]
MAGSASLQHPTLGTLSGISTGKVEQFRGLKYASLKNRFATAELHEGPLTTTTYDATRHGPCAPSLPMGINMEFSFIQQALSAKQFEFSDLECLNLVVTVPKGERSNLPVLVWIHGGGFMIGSSAWPQWDLGKVVELGMDQGMPFVAVGFNFRLGVPGFLTSVDLKTIGNKPNNGLRDQQMALRWVQRHISGFGGNSNNVTAMGQSAGAASVTFHLQSREALFKNAVVMGGTSLLLEPVPQATAENTYRAVVDLLGFQSLPKEQACEQLMTVPFTEFLTKIPPNVPIGPLVDDDLIPSTITFEGLERKTLSFPGIDWCEALWIGDSSLDGMILVEMALRPRMGQIATTFSRSLKRNLPKTAIAGDLLAMYKMSEHTADEDALRCIARFATEIAFNLPSHAWATAFRGKASLYKFEEPNPWDGPYKGEASHILDAAYIFQNFNHLLGPEQRELAQEMGKDLVGFVYGKTPTSEPSSVTTLKDGILVYRSVTGSSTGGVGKTNEDDSSLAKLCEKHNVKYDEVMAAWRAFLAGK